MDLQFNDKSYRFVPWKPEMGRVFGRHYAFDCETTLINDAYPWTIPSYVLGAAFDGHRGFFVTRAALPSFMIAHNGVPLVLHNAAFDLKVMQRLIGSELDVYEAVEADLVWDTRLLHQLLTLATEGHSARGAGQSTLEACAELYAGMVLPKDAKDSKGNIIRLSFANFLYAEPRDIDPTYLEYLAKDVVATLAVFDIVHSELLDALQQNLGAFCSGSKEWLEEQIDKWGPSTHHIQLKGSIVLDQITKNGLSVDVMRAADLVGHLKQRSDELLRSLRQYNYLPGEEGCNKSLQSILGKIEEQHPGIRFERTESGLISTKAESLERLEGQDEFINLYLDYKANEQQLKTFAAKLQTAKLHPSFSPLLNSGRTSSHGDINAQNLPKKKGVRACIVPSAGHVFIDADYKTLELATLAQTVMSVFEIPSEMARRINEGQDLHYLVATDVTGKPINEITELERQQCKAINFGKPGGMGVATLTQYAKASFGVDLTVDEAEGIVKAWFELFPEMTTYMQCRVDTGFGLASLLELSTLAYKDATGRNIPSDDYGLLAPNPILGGMCLKAMRESTPSTGSGRPYSHAEIDFFWQRAQVLAAHLPEKLRKLLRSKKPSDKLGSSIKNLVSLAPVFTITGRLRAGATYCAQRNTPFQGLAADGAKLALWRLWRAGYRIVNFIHDEVLIEVPDDEHVAAKQQEVEQIMIEEMQRVVPDVKIVVESEVLDRWEEPLEDDAKDAA